MRLRRGGRFGELVRRQLDLFERDEADLLAACTAAERAYERAGRDEAHARYAEYAELVESAAGLLAEMRDAYARTLDDAAAGAYAEDFARAVARRLPRLAVGLGDA